MLMRAASLILVLALAAAAQPAMRSDQRPAGLEGVDIAEKPGAQIDLGLEFVGEDGYPHKLGEYFAKGRPVILNLVYYTCPMLCNLVLNGQVAALRDLPWTPGEEFEIVTVSIDPTENFGIARTKKAAYLESYEREAPGWHFLTDYRGNVKKLAGSVGFGYKLDEKTGQYAHAAAIFVLTPQGKVSRYLYGINYRAFDLRLALTEAAEEKFGVTDRVLLYCFHYDPAARGYVPFARNFMQLGGALTLGVLGMALVRLWRRERRLAAAAPARPALGGGISEPRAPASGCGEV
jgi:protein SCO1/2